MMDAWAKTFAAKTRRDGECVVWAGYRKEDGTAGLKGAGGGCQPTDYRTLSLWVRSQKGCLCLTAATTAVRESGTPVIGTNRDNVRDMMSKGRHVGNRKITRQDAVCIRSGTPQERPR